MTKVAVAHVADDFGTCHAMGLIDHFPDVVRIDRFKITGPAAARVKFCIGRKELGPTADTFVYTRGPVIPEATREGAFSPFLAGDVEFLTAKLCFPVSI